MDVEKRLDLINIGAIRVVLVAEDDTHRLGLAQHVAAMGADMLIGLVRDHQVQAEAGRHPPDAALDGTLVAGTAHRSGVTPTQ
jgi:hypothetical protein